MSSKAKNLAAIFQSVSKTTASRSGIKTKNAATATAAKKKEKKQQQKISSSSTSEDATLKQYVSAINSSATTSTSSFAAVFYHAKRTTNNFTPPPLSSSFNAVDPIRKPPSLYDVVDESVKLGSKPGDDESGKQLSTEASTLLYDGLDLDWDDESDLQPLGNVLNFPWLSRMSNNDISLRRKKVSRERKQKWVAKNTQKNRFDRLLKMCAKKVGPDATIELFGRLRRETGLKEYNALIGLSIQKARDADDEDAALEEMYKGHKLFEMMKESGFKIEEETYGQFLKYLIDFGMVQEFYFFCDVIKDGNPDSLPRLAYYEMQLWISLNNGAKIQELLRSVVADNAEDKYSLQENFLLALCESDRKNDLLLLLENFDITKITSDECRVGLFKSLGKFMLEPFAVDYILTLKSSGVENISKFIYEYAISAPNLVVEDIIVKFKTLHAKLDVLPTSAQYEKLVRYSCGVLKVHEAIDMVDEMFEAGLTLTLDTFHSILEACDKSYDYNLVHRIKSMICCHDLKPNSETFAMMTNLFVKMKDFQGAYALMNDLEKMNLTPTASMYNAVMLGYFREKNICSGRFVLKQMAKADVKPDSSTFCHLITNSNCEEDIIKYYNEMCDSGVQPTKLVFMALINAYAACGQYEKAKQVPLNPRIPAKTIDDIKSALVSALACHGQLSDAFKVYEEIEESESSMKPRATRSLIEHIESKGELDRLLRLLRELKDPYWVDCCFRVIKYCVRHEQLRPIVDLLQQLKDKFDSAEFETDTLFDEAFCIVVEKEATDMQFALGLLKAIKTELGVVPSRKSLDFLLSACAHTKDVKSSFLIWKEYEMAGLPYNVLSYLRMYQALLASGDLKSATNILNKMPKDDPHVRDVIKACQLTYKSKGKKKLTIKMLGDLFSAAER